jgi:PAT family beta-lactamase induction signal transducer AmpG
MIDFKKIKLPKFLIALILGLNSGLTYALLGSSFTAYLKDNDVNLVMIGFLSLRMLPYSFKYLWSPFIDSVNLKIFSNDFGQRKSWLITCQVLLIIFIASLGLSSIKKHFYLVCFITFFTAFLAASYDIAMEAYRIELFAKKELNRGTFFNVLGFRMGLIISGAGSLYLSTFLAWNIIFFIIALLIIPCLIITLVIDDRKIITKDFALKNFKIWFKQNFIQPFITLFTLKNFYLIALIISFYKLSDGYMDTMLLPFLIDIGYSKLEIATVSKTFGTAATVLGTAFGSFIISKFNIMSNLLVAELFAASTNLLFIILIKIPHNFNTFLIINCIESFVSGICNILLICYMSSWCDRRFTATHYAILISISGIVRAILSSTSGWTAVNVGWTNFFIISSLLSLPSIICIIYWIKGNKSS